MEPLEGWQCYKPASTMLILFYNGPTHRTWANVNTPFSQCTRLGKPSCLSNIADVIGQEILPDLVTEPGMLAW